MKKPKLVRITTVPISLNLLIRGQMAFMQEKGFDVYTASADGPEIAELTSREKVPHKIVKMTRKITPAADARALWSLVHWFRSLKPDIVHSHTPKAGLLAMTAARIAGVPHRLHTVAGMPLMEASGAKRALLEKAESMTYACSTRIYPNSHNLKKFIEENFGMNNAKMKVLGAGSSNGIDTDYFSKTDVITREAREIRKNYNIPEDDIVFTFVGRIVRDKGINELVAAFRNISQENENVRLMLVGPFEDHLDPVSDETRNEIKSNSSIITTGFQSDIRPFLAASDIFVFPSYREGFPNVVLQASCMELCCIVSDINGCNEIVQNGENGIIVSPKNTVQLQEVMDRLAEDADFRKVCGQEARKRVVENYRQDVLWENIYQEYASLL